MTSPTLAQVAAAMSGDPLTLEAPSSWSQGRTLFGGMTTALSWAAATRMIPDLPPLRTVHTAFVGPAAGLLTLRPEVLRRGRSATTVGVDVNAEAGLAARSTFFCGAARPTRVTHDRVEPLRSPDAADLPQVLAGGHTPGFARNFEIRHLSGGLPYGGGPAEFVMWARLKADEGADPLVALLALADVLPPAAMAVFPEPGVISSLSWSFDLDRLPTDAGAWYLCRAVSESTGDGYSRQAMDLFDAEGRRMLAGRMTIAIFV